MKCCIETSFACARCMEKGSVLNMFIVDCTLDQFKCDMGLCKVIDYWCDGYQNCPDDSDEKPGCQSSKYI